MENVIIGPFIALISFVCSVGVHGGGALEGGTSFGGVISFIFAGPIALPLVLIYRKFYGGALTLRLVALAWLVMAAGLLVESLFRAFGLVPATRPVAIAPSSFRWDYTSILNLAFLALFGLLSWLHRNQARFGGGAGYATDPVCGMQVQVTTAPATAVHAGRTYYFCSDRCHDRFVANPAAFIGPGATPRGMEGPDAMAMAVDPVCGMTLTVAEAAAERTYQGQRYRFRDTDCAEAFDADPERYARIPERGERQR